MNSHEGKDNNERNGSGRLLLIRSLKQGLEGSRGKRSARAHGSNGQLIADSTSEESPSFSEASFVHCRCHMARFFL